MYGIFLIRGGKWEPYWLDLPKWVAEREADLIEGAKVFVRVAAALASFIEPAPECIYCYEPVCDGSVQEYTFGDPEPAHPKCAERAAEAAFEDVSR